MSDPLHTTLIGASQAREGGQRLVFLHGLFGQGKNFSTAAKALVPAAQSLLVDLPNHGRSAWTETVSYEQMADAVAETLRESFAADGPVHVVGHSMGGKVAMVLALRHPDLVDRLVVVDISPSVSDGAGEFEHLLGSLAGVDLDAVRRRSDADEALRGPIPNDTTRAFLLQNLMSTDDGYRWRANLALLRSSLASIGDFPDVDSAFDHPVLWMSGERSDYVLPEHEEKMRRLFPATRLVTIKGAGHWVHSEQPQAFTSALRVFLALG